MIRTILAPFIFLPVIPFWIFLLYVLWTTAQSLKGIAASTREIAQILKTHAESNAG